MSTVAPPEKATQNRLIALFQDQLDYTYLGNWHSGQYNNEDNSNVMTTLLTANLQKRGYADHWINKAIHKIKQEMGNHTKSLYQRNQSFYQSLRYGMKITPDVGENMETVHLIDWDTLSNNDFVIAEEVTLKGNKTRRPDLVIYLNGIAIGVLELKKSTVTISEGIRQLLSNQEPQYNEWFFETVQFCFAGNDSEGLRYGTVGTKAKYYLTWKEDVEEEGWSSTLDKYVVKMCRKERLLELMKDFVLFDGGQKKLPRPHQYFGIKASQERIHNNKGGIIWHSQGSGKSIVMVLLAKWILENVQGSRVAVITDREELDKQIKRVFEQGGHEIYQAQSGEDLVEKLGKNRHRLLCSLIHKFQNKNVEFTDYIKSLEDRKGVAVGQVFVLVDECHRTQSDKLHKAMRASIPDGVFIGFTGTPLLKEDQKTSKEVFGDYIHTYKFDEAVADNIVLDLLYEARNVEQYLSSTKNIDLWFSVKTKGLNDWQRNALKQEWATMQKVLSSKDRLNKIINDILLDFSIVPRLENGRGNAMLVASSIYEACKYYELFQHTPFKGKCAIVTSYNPDSKDMSKEDIGENTETAKQYVNRVYTDLLENVQKGKYDSKAMAYTESAKSLFIKEPANMKLLIVVDKLLTGFDAPSCTYLYIDKKMQDHGLFQAICRTNRLDGEDKTYGYIVDYKDLLQKVENAISVYTSELSEHADKPADILLKDRLQLLKDNLDGALETCDYLCAGVENNKEEIDYIRFFCGNSEIPQDLKDREILRMELYKAVVKLIRAYGGLASEMEEAGYTEERSAEIKGIVQHYTNVREVIRKASGEYLDKTLFDADMRSLIDMYVRANDSQEIVKFEDLSLVEIIVESGLASAINSLSASMRNNKNAVAETIANNVRSTIIKQHMLDPAYYDEMSSLLQAVIDKLKEQQLAYEDYLKAMEEIARKVKLGHRVGLPKELVSPGQRALYNNTEQNLALTLKLNTALVGNLPDNWRGDQGKERQVQGVIYGSLDIVDQSLRVEETMKLYEIVKQYPKEY